MQRDRKQRGPGWPGSARGGGRKLVDGRVQLAGERCEAREVAELGGQDTVYRNPEDILEEIASLDAESAGVLKTIRDLL